jgi:hypothetical protein
MECLQPFTRPGEQKAFTLELDETENLNDYHGIEKYFFRHDKLAAEIIFNRLNQGKELFPPDKLIDLAIKGNKSQPFILSIFQSNRRRNDW